MTDPITRLNAALEGRYRIEREIGEGGMATVYLAHDERHNRNVALKVLKAELAAVVGAERFLAEIETTAKLTHPHILPLHDSGEADGFLFFVAPYIEGDTLRDKIDREKQLGIEEALKITEKVASALDYAHEHGVVHRDIKPGNILLSEKGEPTVADFGIALAVAQAGGGRVTETGLSVGTPHYMSPEQATGDRDVDPRTDVYALGSVLYEMLTGDPPYPGSTAQAVLAKILTDPTPAPQRVRLSIPPNVDAAIRKALEKLPADRFANADDFSKALGEAGFRHGGEPVDVGRASTAPALSKALWFSMGATAGLVLLLAVRSPPPPSVAAPVHLSLDTPTGVSLTYHEWFGTLALSPDGRRLAYVGADNGQRIYLDDLEDPDPARPIPGTEGGASPFFSPDGSLLGFATPTSLSIVSLAGGPPRNLAPSQLFSGGTWTPGGDTIYYSPSVESGIWKVAVTGGQPLQVTTPLKDGYDNNHRHPEMLPGGRRLIYTSAFGRYRLMLVDLESTEVTPILENESAFTARYSSSGHLLYTQAPASLMAVAFDPETLEMGTPVEVADDVILGSQLHAEYGISGSGSLAYLEGVSAFERTLMRVDRSGDRETLDLGGAHPHALWMSFDPSGEQVALSLGQDQTDIFIYDLARGDLRPLVTDPRNDFGPVWSRDGRRVAFSSVRRGQIDLYVAPVDRSGPGDLLHASEQPKWPISWSPGDSLLALDVAGTASEADIWIYSIETDSLWAFLEGPEIERRPRFSPDGQWIAYERGGEVTRDVYVSPFPGPGPECKVSTVGGYAPRWSSSGDEILYQQANRAMAADVADRDFCQAASVELFSGLEGEYWTVSPDGELFVAFEPRPEPRLRLVQNFFEELRQVVPDP